jgi:hypothetical protein
MRTVDISVVYQENILNILRPFWKTNLSANIYGLHKSDYEESDAKLRRMALVRTDVSEKSIASIIRVKRISELGTTLAVTSN